MNIHWRNDDRYLYQFRLSNTCDCCSCFANINLMFSNGICQLKIPETKPVATEPPTTQLPSSQPVTEDEEVPETTAPVETAPLESETNPSTEETTPETEPEPEEEPEPFDIASWVSFAKSYAQSIGLNLDSSAVDCWDNPITAGSHCLYLERDICNRLNRYHADEDITDVWIWAVDVGNGCYDLYIGYA